MAGKSQRCPGGGHPTFTIKSREKRNTCLLPSAGLVQYSIIQGPAQETVLSILGWTFVHQLTMKTAILKHATGRPGLDSSSIEILLSEDFKLREVDIENEPPQLVSEKVSWGAIEGHTLLPSGLGMHTATCTHTCRRKHIYTHRYPHTHAHTRTHHIHMYLH